MSTPTPSDTVPLIDSLAVERSRQFGALSVLAGASLVELPLARVEVSARVADRVASITVRQTYRNPHVEHLEAVYVFPLAGGSAVTDFEMRVGDRTIRGLVRERGEARQDYERAVRE